MTTAEQLEARGEVLGKIRALLIILPACGITLATTERERITTCTDTDQLDIWVTRAATATTAADIFD